MERRSNRDVDIERVYERPPTPQKTGPQFGPETLRKMKYGLITCTSVITIANVIMLMGAWDVENDMLDGGLQAAVLFCGVASIFIASLFPSGGKDG